MIDLAIAPTVLTAAQLPHVYDLIARAGAGVVSTAAGWASMQSGPSAPIQWDVLDAVVSAAHARGMKVRMQLASFPAWARDPGSDTATTTPPQTAGEIARYAAFAGQLAGHFAGRLDYLEVWNEPNLAQFWSTGPNPGSYAALLMATYQAVKAAAPATAVITGGLSGNDVGFVAAMYRAIVAAVGQPEAQAHHYYFDLLGVHPYSGNRSPATVLTSWVHPDQFGGQLDENFTGFTRLHDLMDAIGDTGKKIYIGEYGFSTDWWAGFAPVPDATRAAYLRQAYDIAQRYGYLEAMSWFYLLSTPWDGGGFALLDWSQTPSQTFQALVAVAQARGISR